MYYLRTLLHILVFSKAQTMCTRIIFVLFVMASISDDVQFCVSGQQFTNIQEKVMEVEANKHDNLHGTLDVNANNTTKLTRIPSYDGQSDADPSVSRLLHVTVPSSVRARPDAWKEDQVPEEDDLDKFMKNATGCEYMADGSYHGDWQSVSGSPAPAPARGGTWRRRLAVRGERSASIRVTWGAGHGYDFDIGYNSNTMTKVYDYTRDTYLLRRVTPSVMSQDKYTLFYYIQLEDGVMSFGQLGNITPWLRHDVTVSAGDVVEMKYFTTSHYGVKLLVCA